MRSKKLIDNDKLNKLKSIIDNQSYQQRAIQGIATLLAMKLVGK